MQEVGKALLISGSILLISSVLGLFHTFLPRYTPYLHGAFIVLGILFAIVGTYIWVSTGKADRFWEFVRQTESDHSWQF